MSEFLDSYSPMYLFCAVFGFVFLVIQFLMMCFSGFGGDSDMDGGDGGDAGDAGDTGDGDTGDGDAGDGDGAHGVGHGSVLGFLKILSLRTCSAGLAFFGLAGLGSESAGIHPIITFLIAMIAGFFGILLVYLLFRLLYSLRYSGSIQEGTLLGCKGTVHVRIPPARSGAGKILVNQQERTMEYEAVSDYEETLPAGTPIVIAEILSSLLVRVEKV
ncbi:MAG: hypothetical protein Q4G69_06905 [Planctomycetia bacterium]|nr:hypothetical protein [Planctomycetia bacterium]